MPNIKLTRGLSAEIDERDLPTVAAHKWYAVKSKSGYYAQCSTVIDGRRAVIYMHRLLMSLPRGDRRRVDHKDGDGLNNRRSNLRICTHAQNLRNQHRKQKTKSGFKGVWRSRSKVNPWSAMYMKDGVRHYLGLFPTAEEAARAYDAGVKVAFGEFASLNFPETDDAL